ncbi:hypothetical protein FB451DRAFT_1491260 [Mycena latifolia]|nr:hypothetical protein FB451DRAFT_1491260 [Mycena latifolia]
MGLLDARSLHILLTTLPNPMGSGAACSLVLHNLILPFCTVEDHKGIQTKEPQFSLVLRAAMAFLTFPQTKEAMSALRQNVSKCRCVLDDGIMERLHKPQFKSSDALELSYSSFIFNLTSIVGGVLSRQTPGQLHRIRKGRAAEGQPWPLSESDLFSGGRTCANTLAVFLIWVEDIPTGAGALGVIASLLTYWKAMDGEVGKTPRIFRLATDHLKFALAKYDEKLDVTHCDFIYPTLAATRFFCSIGQVPNVTLRAFVLERALRAELLPLSLRLQTLEPQLAMFPEVALFSIILLKYAQPGFGHPTGTSPDTFYAQAFTGMGYIRGQHKCTNPACPGPAGTNTSGCSRCGIVRYCGSECQRAAWRASIFPHKQLCDAVHTLRRAIELEDEAEWKAWFSNDGGTSGRFDPAPHRPDFVSLCFRKSVDPVLCETIYSLMAGLSAIAGGHPIDGVVARVNPRIRATWGST